MSEFIAKLTNDVIFKIVFGSHGSEVPLRALLNALLELGPGERIEHVEILNPGLDGAHVDDKTVILDVRVRDERRRQYNIEVQVAREPHFEKRATYYLSKLHAEQLVDGEDYGVVAPTVVICILDHIRFRARAALHSRYRLTERDHGDVLTEDVQIHFIELPKFEKRNPDELGTPAEKWLHMLRFAQEYARGGEGLPEKLILEEGVAMVFDKMQRAQSDEEKRSWAFSREIGKHDEATRMVVARDEGRQEGLEQGLQQGLEQGLQQGLEQGRREALRRQREIVRGMLDEGFEVPVVARLTRLTEAEVVALRDASLEGEQAGES